MIADIYAQLRDFLSEGNQSGQWRVWIQLKNRPDYKERALARMKKYRHWSRASFEEKAQIAMAFLATFLYDEAELNAAIAEIDKNQ